MLITKTEQVRIAVRAGDHLAALRLTRTLRMLPAAQRTTLQRAYEAMVRPGFYCQLGRDPDPGRGADAARPLWRMRWLRSGPLP